MPARAPGGHPPLAAVPRAQTVPTSISACTSGPPSQSSADAPHTETIFPKPIPRPPPASAKGHKPNETPCPAQFSCHYRTIDIRLLPQTPTLWTPSRRRSQVISAFEAKLACNPSLAPYSPPPLHFAPCPGQWQKATASHHEPPRDCEFANIILAGPRHWHSGIRQPYSFRGIEIKTGKLEVPLSHQ